MGKADKGRQSVRFSLKERLNSFRYGFHGIETLFRYEHNARIHLLVLTLAVIAGILFRIQSSGWLAILFVTGLVFVAECFNTAVEYMSDEITGEQNERIGKAKDVAAAGVLIAAVISVITGLIIFLPGILRLIRKLLL